MEPADPRYGDDTIDVKVRAERAHVVKEELEAGTLLSREARDFTVREALTLLVADYERRGCRSLRALKGHVATWNHVMGDEVAKLGFPLLEPGARLAARREVSAGQPSIAGWHRSGRLCGSRCG